MTSAPRMLTIKMMDELRNILRERDARVEKLWRNPLEAGDVVGTFKELGLPLPDELKVWWSSHDGVANELYGTFGLAWWPMPVDETVKGTLLRRRWSEQSDILRPWPPSWAAFGFDGSHGWLACDCAVAPGSPSPIYMYSDYDPMPKTPILPSMGELVSFWIDAVRDGTLRVGEDGGFVLLEPDEKEQARGELADLL